MKNNVSFLIVGFLIGLLATSAAVGFNTVFGNTQAESKKVLKLAHGLETTHPVHIAMEEFKKEIEIQSDGSLSIDIYSGGVLGDEIKCMEQIKSGSLDMTKASSAQIGVFVPRIYLLTLAYIYADKDHYWKVLDSQLGEKFLSFITSENMLGLCYYDAGARCFYTSKKKITNPDDLKGLKIRVMNSRADMEMVSCFNASPTPVSAAETYTSLAQGLVDGAENNLPTYLSSAQFEVCKYYTFDEHTMIPDILLIGEKSWSKLSDSERKIIKDAALKSSLFQRELWAKSEKEAMKTLTEKGVEFINVDKTAFVEKTNKIYEKYSGEEAELIEEIRNANK